MPFGGLLTSTAISAGSSLLGGLFGSSAASKAAAAQAAAAKQAAQGQQQAGAQAQGFQEQQLQNNTRTAQPYLNLGSTTANELTNALAPGGSLTQGWNQTFSGPTAAQAAATPGEQFMLQQGINALQNSAAAKGGLLSTGTAKNLTNYAEGTASTGYQQAYNNALQSYNTNQNSFYTNQNNLYNRLSGSAQLGANTASNLNSINTSGTNALASGIMGNQQQVGSDLMGGANATASGIIGSTNALTGGLAGAANAVNQGVTLNSILGAQNASNGNTYVPSVNNGTFSYSGGTEAGTGFAPPTAGAGLWGTNALIPQSTLDPFSGQLPGGIN